MTQHTVTTCDHCGKQWDSPDSDRVSYTTAPEYGTHTADICSLTCAQAWLADLEPRTETASYEWRPRRNPFRPWTDHRHNRQHSHDRTPPPRSAARDGAPR